MTGALLVALDLLIDYLAQRLAVLAKLVKHLGTETSITAQSCRAALRTS